jgi:cell fate (sporulation/competence/biofilm development) regulator YlbF (YheA/YmcA/DUF963 family)
MTRQRVLATKQALDNNTTVEANFLSFKKFQQTVMLFPQIPMSMRDCGSASF